MTSCTSYTFLYFVKHQNRLHKQRKLYLDYLEQRRRLRLVCRTWNESVLITSPRWLHLDDKRDRMYKLDAITPHAGRVHPVERLSTVITSVDLVIPTLSRVSHVFKRPATQSPLRAYALRLAENPAELYKPLDYLVGTNSKYTNTTLWSLAMTTPFNVTMTISLPQISSTFTGLRSLILTSPTITPKQTITLPNLELLYIHYTTGYPFITFPVRTWDTSSLRHVYLAHFTTAADFAAVLDGFLRRYASQIESLVLLQPPMSSTSCMDLPSDFWETFSGLELVGMSDGTLERRDWTGWTVVPPTTHPLQYLVCHTCSPLQMTVEAVQLRWTYHQGVKLVVDGFARNILYSDRTYHLVEDVRDEQWKVKMEETCGVLPAPTFRSQENAACQSLNFCNSIYRFPVCEIVWNFFKALFPVITGWRLFG